MSWDKRATTRREGSPAPSRKHGVNVVYVGLTEYAEREGYGRGTSLRIGDSFRLLPGSAITLGRGRLCEVTIESEMLSDAHALIAFVPGDESWMMVVDLQTEHGTWVGGRSQPQQLIGPGGEFELAQIYRFRCQPAGDEDAVSHPSA